MDLNIKFK